ncbi:MAG: hypothetical protein FWF92_00220 [Oscillospiraceae bacterium]|nr:hypothetical protein [Oscillospiraceae bacterium]
MKNIDLLYFDNKNNNYQPADAGRVNDLFISDMGIEHIKNLEGFFGSETYNIFINTISVPLTDAEKIKERQNILKDFMEYPGIAQKMKSICDEIKINKCQSPETDAKQRMIDFRNILYSSMDVSHELAKQLTHRDFQSDSLKDLRNQLDCREKTEKVKERINAIVDLCLNDNLVLNIEYGSGFKFKNAYIYSGENNNKQEIKENAILKFFQNRIPKQKEIVSGFYYNENFLVAEEVEGEKGIIPLIAPYFVSVISNLNRHILNFCASLSKHLSFYIACIEIVKFMENNNIKTVYPEFHGGEKGINAKNLYDFGLLLPKPDQENNNINSVTPNDFDDSGNNIYLISGANQGGKTTFLKSIGIAQLFAQAGLKIPAEEYKCPVFNNFFSHFPKDEDEALNFGKLAEELTRLKKDMPIITDNALVLLNESFATTTETEGFEIAADMLKAVSASETPPKILFVTHNYQLLKKRHEIGRLLERETKIKSLIVSEGKNTTDRTYKIIEGEPQENINTAGFLNNLFFTGS